VDDAGRQGLYVVPLCPFSAYYIEQHAEYAGLIAQNYLTKGA
jgi:predicted GNAT family acetyltransferase